MPATIESVVTTEEFQRELRRLRADLESRIAALEHRVSTVPEPASVRQPLSPETIAIIAAAVTSFLGKKVKLHHVHLLDAGSSPWAQQGRAIIQASHNLVR